MYDIIAQSKFKPAIILFIWKIKEYFYIFKSVNSFLENNNLSQEIGIAMCYDSNNTWCDP